MVCKLYTKSWCPSKVLSLFKFWGYVWPSWYAAALGVLDLTLTMSLLYNLSDLEPKKIVVLAFMISFHCNSISPEHVSFGPFLTCSPVVWLGSSELPILCQSGNLVQPQFSIHCRAAEPELQTWSCNQQNKASGLNLSKIPIRDHESIDASVRYSILPVMINVVPKYPRWLNK